jgi:flagellar biosynthesis chaperone FliJ
MRCKKSIATLALAAVVMMVPAHAQTQRSGGGEAQKFMQQYQQVAAEKTALQAQVAQMKKDLDTAQSELAAAKKERDALKAHAGASAAVVGQLNASNASKDTAEKNLEQYKQRMTELVSRFRETANNLKEIESDRTQLRKSLDERNYEHVGLFTKAGAVEPFTRITRTRIENLTDEYRARALELRVKKRNP